jgi:Cu-processing system permease protein
MLIAARNRWVLATTLLLAALALSIAFLGSAPTGHVGMHPLAIVVVSLSSLTIFLLPLIALLISHDTVVGEMERGTLPLTLTYPITRWQIVLGKFTGHGVIVVFATTMGYGAAAGALILAGIEMTREGMLAFAAMIASSVLLGVAFVAIGCCISTLTRERATAGGIAIGIWLALVLLYDTGLLGLLVVDQGRFVTSDVLKVLLLLNPTDVYRMLNLAGFSDVSRVAGMAGLASTAGWSVPALLIALLAWIVLPLGTAIAFFARREI